MKSLDQPEPARNVGTRWSSTDHPELVTFSRRNQRDARREGAEKTGRSDMAFFTSRERAALSSAGDADVEGQIRAFVRQDRAPIRQPQDQTHARRDYAPLRQPQDQDYALRQQRREHNLAGSVSSDLQRVSETSLMQIDNLIVELQMQREKLLSESTRVQRDIVEFARLSQSTMQSTKIIAESLVYWNKVSPGPCAAPNTKASFEEATCKERRLESAAEVATAPREETDNQDEATTVENNLIPNPIDQNRQNPVPIEQPD
jgi:curved DNA-binding protein CbpA